MQIKASGQQYLKPITIPPINAKVPSTYGPTLSLLAPLIIAVSDAIADVNTLGPLSLLSNHPIFFCKILK